MAEQNLTSSLFKKLTKRIKKKGIVFVSVICPGGMNTNPQMVISESQYDTAWADCQ